MSAGLSPHHALSLSARVSDLHPSPIREILEVVGRPGMISFAGGLPAAETFPEFGLAAPDSALQYGPSEGDPALRERIALELAALGHLSLLYSRRTTALLLTLLSRPQPQMKRA